ncbi:Abi family protein [Flavobacterium sp. 5]|uniref:Abi family protein n=1 Tax=Flavobacterium sp. 5 TaxID=2035199 RepID=UPI000C2C47F9|nr:Abi family protein [Flavobacterium sp. 5]PKB17059.1 abortive infection bacteriophage resistance protein [Flavobacterium sp. 5]
MGGIATNVEIQIQKLTDRGLELDWGLEKTKEILLDIGYYRLGFYWNPFEIDKNHNFKKGTKFSDVVKLYYLDVDLKNILNKAINRIEINLRTQLIYSVSNKYPEYPTWFANKKVMYPNFVDDFPKYYTTKFKENNKPIKKHHANYPNDIYAPAWKTLEFLSFGSIYTMYNALRNEDLKIQIANYYGVKKVKVFLNYFKTIIFIRNICAHSGLLFDCNTPKEIETTPLIQFNNNNRHSLDSSIKVILYFLEIISTDRKIKIEQEIIDLFKSHEDNVLIISIITKKIGYVKK